MSKKTVKTTRRQPVRRLSGTELDKMSAEFDAEFVADTFGAPPPAAKTRLRRAKRKPGRPSVGAGSQPISVTVEKMLLKRIDRLARVRQTTRARLIARGLRAVLRAEEAAPR